jgi:hypothetical protein
MKGSNLQNSNLIFVGLTLFYLPKWLNHPIATMDEAEKNVCFLTDDNQYDKDHVARLSAGTGRNLMPLQPIHRRTLRCPK